MNKKYGAEIMISIVALAILLGFGAAHGIENKILNWPDNGLYLMPYACSKFSVLPDSQITMPVLVVGKSIEDYKFAALKQNDGKLVVIDKVTVFPKIEYAPDVKFYLVQCKLRLKNATNYSFTNLCYSFRGRKLQANIKVSMEKGDPKDIPLCPQTIETNEVDNIIDLDVSNGSNEMIQIIDVQQISPEIKIVEKRLTKNKRDFYINQNTPMILTGETVHIKIKFIKKDPLASVEVSPKVVYLDSRKNRLSTSVFASLYPGNIEARNLIAYFRK